MQMLPSGKKEWLSFVAFPLKLLVAASVVVYPFWNNSVHPFRAGTFSRGGIVSGPDYWIVDANKLPFDGPGLLLGYLVIFLALATMAVIQALSTDRRGAVWSAVFAVAAFYVAYCVAFHPFYK